MNSPPSLSALVQELANLPGIGKKSARRMAYHLLRIPRERALALADAVVSARQKIRECEVCFQYTENSPCIICSDVRRDNSLLCVVEKPSDIETLEKSGVFRGVYHVLGGVLSPLDGIGPDQLRLAQLKHRALQGMVAEVVVALGSSPEAESTSILIDRMLEGSGLRRTRLARGIPVGSELDFVDEPTMLRAFEGRIGI